MRKIGVTVEIVSYEWAEYLKLSSAKDRDGAAILGWTGDNGDPDNFLDTLLGCDAVGGNNRAQWCNKEFDDLVTKAKATADVAERTKLYEEAQIIFKKEAPWDTLDHSLVVVPMSKKVYGLRPDPARHSRLTASTSQSKSAPDRLPQARVAYRGPNAFGPSVFNPRNTC